MLSSEIPVSEDATKFNKGAFGGVRSKLICKAVEAALILPALSAMLAVKLRYLDASTARRVKIASYYCEQCADFGLILPTTPAGYEAVYHLFVVESAHRDTYMTRLKAAGVSTDIHYPMATHHQPIYQRYAPNGGLAVTERQAQTVFSLPNFPELTDSEVEFVAQTVRSVAATIEAK